VEFWHEPAGTIIGATVHRKKGGRTVLARRSAPWVPVLLLALLAAGCGHSKSPTAPHYAAGDATTSDLSPGAPGGSIPEAGDSPLPAPFPSATITPRPNHLFEPTMPPTFTVHWSPNVPAPGGPVPTRYRYRLFSEFDPEFDFLQLLANPESMLRFYAPGFAGWTEVAGNVTQAELQDLSPSEKHVFVVIALDDHGHFDSVLSYDRNAMFFHVSQAAAASVEDTQELPGTR
jgi:hypothetical protein